MPRVPKSKRKGSGNVRRVRTKSKKQRHNTYNMYERDCLVCGKPIAEWQFRKGGVHRDCKKEMVEPVDFYLM